MKKISLLSLLFLISCSKNEELNSDFRKIIIDYQNTYPVKNPRKGNIYIYGATFYKIKNDTIFMITRTGAGIMESNKFIYGIYKDEELKNFVIFDDSKLSMNQVNIYKKKLPDSLIWKSDVFPESITPIAKYKIVNKVPKFIKTDTIWNHWD